MTCSAVPSYLARAAALAVLAALPVTGVPKPGGAWPLPWGTWAACPEFATGAAPSLEFE
jgi:hypothetical protein